MQVSPIFTIILVAMVPIVIFASLIIVPQNVMWQPPVVWKTESHAGLPMASDNTGVYGTGASSVLKFDLNGQQVWNSQLGSNMTIETLSAGTDGLYVGGTNYTNPYSTFVVKLDSHGGKAWGMTFSQQARLGISASGSGLYLAGVPYVQYAQLPPPEPLTLRHYDINGGILWTKVLTNETSDQGSGPDSGSVLVSADSNGTFVAGSDLFMNSTTSTRAFISRIDASGGVAWTRLFDPPNNLCLCHPYGLSSDSSGAYVGGLTERSLPGETYFSSGGGSFLRKYDPKGNILWTGGNPGGYIQFLSVGGQSVYTFEGAIARYDSYNGNTEWSFYGGGILGTSGGDGFYAVSRDGRIEKYSQSASLEFFGVNPPYSFLITGILVSITPAAILLLRIRQGRRDRPPQDSKWNQIRHTTNQFAC